MYPNFTMREIYLTDQDRSKGKESKVKGCIRIVQENQLLKRSQYDGMQKYFPSFSGLLKTFHKNLIRKTFT